MNHFPSLVNSHTRAKIPINNSTFSIGRAMNCDYIVESLGISRYHCVLKKNDNKWTLYDQSMNGTNVNGVMVRRNKFVELKTGDVLKLGSDNVEYVFVEPAEIVTFDDMSKDNTLVVVDSTELEQAGQWDGDEEEEAMLVAATSTTDELSQDDGEVGAAREECGGGGSREPPEPDPCTAKTDEAVAGCSSTSGSKTMDAMEDELTCSICSELFIKAVTLTCSHTFCKFCISEWQKNKSICPICRGLITIVSPTIVLDNYIEKMIESQSDEVKQSRSDLMRQREEATAGPASSPKPTPSTSGQVYGVIEISEEDDDDEDDDDDFDEDDYDYDPDTYPTYEDFADEFDMQEDDDYGDDETPYNGLPGVYYGGYGRCFTCGRAGHWANGCPLKRTR